MEKEPRVIFRRRAIHTTGRIMMKKTLITNVRLDLVRRTHTALATWLCIFVSQTSCEKRASKAGSDLPISASPKADLNSEGAYTGSDAKEHVLSSSEVGLASPVGVRLDQMIQTYQTTHNLDEMDKMIKLVEEIGRRKQTEAVPSLLSGMLIIRSFITSGVLTGYPCSDALIEVGEPAVPQVKGKLLSTEIRYEQLILLGVLIKVDGTQKTANWLEDVQSMSSIPERRQRFIELKKWVLSHTN